MLHECALLNFYPLGFFKNTWVAEMRATEGNKHRSQPIKDIDRNIEAARRGYMKKGSKMKAEDACSLLSIDSDDFDDNNTKASRSIEVQFRSSSFCLVDEDVHGSVSVSKVDNFKDQGECFNPFPLRKFAEGRSFSERKKATKPSSWK